MLLRYNFNILIHVVDKYHIAVVGAGRKCLISLLLLYCLIFVCLCVCSYNFLLYVLENRNTNKYNIIRTSSDTVELKFNHIIKLGSYFQVVTMSHYNGALSHKSEPSRATTEPSQTTSEPFRTCPDHSRTSQEPLAALYQLVLNSDVDVVCVGPRVSVCLLLAALRLRDILF